MGCFLRFQVVMAIEAKVIRLNKITTQFKVVQDHWYDNSNMQHAYVRGEPSLLAHVRISHHARLLPTHGRVAHQRRSWESGGFELSFLSSSSFLSLVFIFFLFRWRLLRISS